MGAVSVSLAPRADTSLTNPLLLIAIGLFAGGFVAINKFGESSVREEPALPAARALVLSLVR